MGLDVYVGSLTRYYAGDWETIVQRVMREAGQDVLTLRAGIPDTAEPATNSGEIAAAVVAWRTALADELGNPLGWLEDSAGSYFTDKPAWDGYGSLQVLAASVELGESNLPDIGVENWSEDVRWQRAASSGEARFAHLYFPEIWFPVDVPAPFNASDARGREVAMGSSERLLTALREINDATFQASEADLALWRRENAEYGGPFELTARFGLAVFLELAMKSVSERLPMLLDY